MTRKPSGFGELLAPVLLKKKVQSQVRVEGGDLKARCLMGKLAMLTVIYRRDWRVLGLGRLAFLSVG